MIIQPSIYAVAIKPGLSRGGKRPDRVCGCRNPIRLPDLRVFVDQAIEHVGSLGAPPITGPTCTGGVTRPRPLHDPATADTDEEG